MTQDIVFVVSGQANIRIVTSEKPTKDRLYFVSQKQRQVQIFCTTYPEYIPHDALPTPTYHGNFEAIGLNMKIELLEQKIAFMKQLVISMLNCCVAAMVLLCVAAMVLLFFYISYYLWDMLMYLFHFCPLHFGYA